MARPRRENGAGTEPKQGANGRWWLKVSYRDPETDDLERTTIRGASQGEVLSKKKEFLRSIEAGVKPKAKKMTLQEWLDTWLEVNKISSVSGKSYIIYQTIIDNHIKDTALGKKDIDKVKRVDIQRFINEKGETVAPSYIGQIKAVLADALNVAELDHLILRNPCKKIKLPQVEKEEIHPLNQEEVKKLLDTGGSGSALYNIIFFTLHTGVRRGEVCGIRWTDIDFKNKRIEIKQQAKVDRTHDKKPYLGKLKTKSSYRTIPIGNRLIEVLKWHQAQQNRLKNDLGEAYNDLDLVFCEPDGNITYPNTLDSRFTRLMAKTPIERRTFHQLRHTFASVAISQGLNIKAISKILGHAKTSITLDVYGHLLPGDAETVTQAVAAYYGV
ncbi:tyrosine recombinase XerC [Acetonema longum]|uniref:Phage integrase n=1 Tax=Acetonema longum DSM 6540 TaxID=1009370 RepID=F7NPG2_9FIRM|nr:site-specific integrase [Acetonema longum]EGO62124.1 Phage integrase [Acetonema longum DSM 6540]